MLSSIANIKRKTNQQRPDVPPHVVFASYIGDRSGSMRNQQKASANGCYEWVKSMSEGIINNGQEGYLTVTFFDDAIEKRIDNIRAKEIVISYKECDYWSRPRGMTKLYDTAIMEINELRSRIKEHKKNNPELKVHGIFQLFSDGTDNKSIATEKQLNYAIQEARDDGITCYYLGIGQDAIKIGKRYGFSEEESLSVDIGNTTSELAFRGCSLSAIRSASTGISSTFKRSLRMSSAPSQY